jgi:hypothetical protein
VDVATFGDFYPHPFLVGRFQLDLSVVGEQNHRHTVVPVHAGANDHEYYDPDFSKTNRRK